MTDHGRAREVRLGYLLALTNAVISGYAVYYNASGVRLFRDSTELTTLKNLVAGVILALPILFLPRVRAELRGLRGRDWIWLAALALVGGSVAYVLFFRGLQLTTAATGSLANHVQFLFVAALAVFFLRERLHPLAWLALVLLGGGVLVDGGLDLLRVNSGLALLLASSVLFAAGFVIAKHLLRQISAVTVMAAKMTAGSLGLLVYAALSGHLTGLLGLGTQRWDFVIASGLILVAFTVTIMLAIQRAPVSAVMAVGAIAPLVTTWLQVMTGRSVVIGPADVYSYVLGSVGVAVLVLAGAFRGRPVAVSLGADR